MRYTDLELLAQEPLVVNEDGKKLLRFTVTVVGFLEPTKCEIDLKAAQDLQSPAIASEATWQEARQLGQAHSNVLLPTKILDVINDRINVAEAQGEGLRIRLILSGSDLDNLPWEFLLFPTLAANTKLDGARKEAMVESFQRIENLSGRAIAIKVDHLSAEATAKAIQEIDVVNKGAEAVGFQGGTAGGNLEVDQKINQIDGDATGAEIKII